MKAPLTFASDAEIAAQLNCDPGSLGPVNAGIPVIVDRSAAVLADFICGANQTGKHMTGVNWQRDCNFDEIADLREVVEGDPSPCGEGKLVFKRGIEVGHIFQLGQKYAEAMNATVLNDKGRAQVMTMGCYGIGVTRVVAAAIEQNNDDKGIIWPEGLAPFQVGIVPLNYDKSELVKATADCIYQQLSDLGIDVYMDDRDKKTSPGVKFADMDLIGIPHRLVISDRGLKENQIEYQERRSQQRQDLAAGEAVAFIKSTLKA